jgi:hypothetical protein
LTPDITRKSVALLKPRDQYRFRSVADPFTEMDDIVRGQNPPGGAALNFWLASAPKDSAAKDSVTLTIANAAGAVVRTFKAPAKAGLNRAYWDLRGEKTTEAILRTSPLYSDWFDVKQSGKSAPGISRYAILEPPGTYTVTLRYGSAQESQPLVILKDPSSGGSEQTIAAQMETQRAIVSDINNIVGQVNALEIVRGQLAALVAISGKDSSYAELKRSAESLTQKVVSVEQQLYQMRTTGRGQDALRWPVQIAEQLLYLAESVGGSDYAPTAPQKEVAQLLHQRMVKVTAQVEQLLKQDVPAFNEGLRGRNVHPVVSSGR